MYRFSNYYVKRPKGIKNIAVESVYDTSHQVISHQDLWNELQTAVASDGHFILSDRNRADALIRIHLQSVNIGPTGTTHNYDPLKKEPDLAHDGQRPPLPNEMIPLTLSGFTSQVEVINVLVKVEVWNLYSKERIYEKTLSGSSSFRSIGQPSSKGMFFTRYEEGLKTHFKSISSSIAHEIVKDLISNI